MQKGFFAICPNCGEDSITRITAGHRR
jgi:predicted RNA-binding Zn-ribbon protein involved in translation (DUF1610 family)